MPPAFCFQNGIPLQNTSDRLNALVRVGKLSDDFKNSIQEAYEEMLDLLLHHQINQVAASKEPTKKSRSRNSAPRTAAHCAWQCRR